MIATKPARRAKATTPQQPKKRTRTGFTTMTVQQYRRQEHELSFERRVEELLAYTRLIWAHNDDSRRMRGSGAKGICDIDAFDPDSDFWLVAELKRNEREKLSGVRPEQYRYLAHCQAHGADTYIWCPIDEEEICALLQPYALRGMQLSRILQQKRLERKRNLNAKA